MLEYKFPKTSNDGFVKHFNRKSTSGSRAWLWKGINPKYKKPLSREEIDEILRKQGLL